MCLIIPRQSNILRGNHCGIQCVFLVSNTPPLLIKFMKHFSIIVPQILHCECRDPVIPFNSNLLCIQHHIHLTFAGYGLSEKSVIPNQPVYAWSYKLFLSCAGKTRNTTVSCKIQPNIPTLLQVVGGKLTPPRPGIWGCISLILLVPQKFRPLELAVELLQVLIYLFMLAVPGLCCCARAFFSCSERGGYPLVVVCGFLSTGFACCQAGARGHMDLRSCSSQA